MVSETDSTILETPLIGSHGENFKQIFRLQPKANSARSRGAAQAMPTATSTGAFLGKAVIPLDAERIFEHDQRMFPVSRKGILPST